ncbi:hypothetical protein MUG84_16790 [Paenibacillus sp. KQZ6P-2]|uniref:Uncharacterized protein n=1 Tax=Paenibacillus mangrovi TaxID=2931978 RepID=A0A9X1WQW2_9BACL|nr:hypothetical protein [Paenibacillus mangrovi]MCJ8013388.1 hypothetical protein [Paenibacillus mangrovi]
MLSDLLMFVNCECNVTLPRGFDKVDEYERFPLVADIWVYFIHQLEDLEAYVQDEDEVHELHEVRKVIPFPTDRIKIKE